MRRFHLCSIALISIFAVTACSGGDDNLQLGSRDDIVVNNRNMPTPKPIPAQEKAEIETVEMKKEMPAPVAVPDAAADVEVETPPTVKVKEQQEQTVAENKAPQAMAKVVAAPVTPPEPMDTVTMKSMVPPKVQEPVATSPAAPRNIGDVPPNAKPGECYAKVLIPAVREAVEERVQISEEQEVLARIVPPQYRIETEQVVIKEARQYWKPGEGPIQKLDEATGQILCLVEEPAVYKTIEKKILVTPEQPEYKTVPAQFETVLKTTILEPERLEWRRILCQTNMNATTISRIQQALAAKGYDVGPIDGQVGNKTLKAITAYQTKNGLATRGITYETLDHMGVDLIGA